MGCENFSPITRPSGCDAYAGKVMAFFLFKNKVEFTSASLALAEINKLYEDKNFVGVLTNIAQADNANVAPVMDEPPGYGVSEEVAGVRQRDNYTFMGTVCEQKSANKLVNKFKIGYALIKQEDGKIVGFKPKSASSVVAAFPIKFVSNTPTGAELNGQAAPKDVLMVDRGLVSEYINNRIFVDVDWSLDDLAMPAIVELKANTSNSVKVVDECMQQPVNTLVLADTQLAVAVNGVTKTVTLTSIAGNVVTFSFGEDDEPVSGDVISVSLTQVTDEITEVISNELIYAVA